MPVKTRSPKPAADAPNLMMVPFLKDAPARALRAAEKETRYFSLPSGWMLFDEGDPSDSIYFVLSGSLGAFHRAPDGRVELVGHIRAGEPVGEMSLLAGEARSNPVFALRDCELLEISRAGFMALARAEPSILERLVRVIMIRLRQQRKTGRAAAPRVYGLVATSPTIDLSLRVRALADALRRLNMRVAVAGPEAVGMPAAWFDELEARNDVVFLTTTIGDTPWFRFTVRHSDRIWILARADARPSVPLMPDDPSPARRFRLVDLVLLHHGADRRAAEPAEWKAAADAARVFHWDGLNDRDCMRLARVIAAKSVGLVMSGGGARAYAHVGALRALREAGCPIDFVGGASMGAVVGACYAMGWSDDEIDERIRRAFVENNPLADYRLPVVALVKGDKVDARLLEHFGDKRIEELNVPFFAVSSNLTNGSFRVHSEGLLREALRASISLPGILPPVVDGHQVLVDGAVLNNFPVDVMRDLHRGRIIGIDVARPPEGLMSTDFENPPGFVRWTIKNGFSSPPPIANLLMRVATIGINTREHRELTDLLIVPELEGIELRDWKKYDAAVEEGYMLMREALAGLSGPLAQIIEANAAAAAA
jgi:NTE family protein